MRTDAPRVTVSDAFDGEEADRESRFTGRLPPATRVACERLSIGVDMSTVDEFRCAFREGIPETSSASGGLWYRGALSVCLLE